MVREVLTDWTTPAGGGFVTVMYFADEEPSIGSVRLQVATLWQDLAEQLSAQVSWTVRPSGRILDTTTGALTGEWAESTPYTGVGDSSAQPVADSTQVLLRWRTGVVVGGRFLRGRTFVPGLLALSLTGGNINGGALAVLQAGVDAFTDFVDSALVVWHRPVNGAGGVAAPVVSGDVWSELAVLRRRRG